MLVVLQEFVTVLVKVLYYWLEAIVLVFLPARLRGKDVLGQTVLITGAGSGIGRLLAHRFANLGCNLVLWDINKEGLEVTAEQVKGRAPTVWTYVVDLSSRDQIYKTKEKMRGQGAGEVDILVNNAGMVTGRKVLECPDDMVEKTMAVNVMAHFWTLKCFLPGMLGRGRGHVVTVASSAGLLGVSGLGDYCASKFAAVGLDESLRFELDYLGQTGVHTTVVCPYLINTGMFEGCKSRFPWLMDALQPEYVADSVVEAVLCNQQVLYLPRMMYLFICLKGILPVKCNLLLCDFMGVNSMMDTFQGRGAKA